MSNNAETAKEMCSDEDLLRRMQHIVELGENTRGETGK